MDGAGETSREVEGEGEWGREEEEEALEEERGLPRKSARVEGSTEKAFFEGEGWGGRGGSDMGVASMGD